MPSEPIEIAVKMSVEAALFPSAQELARHGHLGLEQT